MNIFVKYALTFVGGVILGGGASYIFTKKRAEERADREIEEMSAHYNKKIVDLEAELYDISEDTPDETVNEERKAPEKYKSEPSFSEDSLVRAKYKHVKTTATDYTKYYSDHPEENEHPEDDAPEDDGESKSGHKFPKFIKAEDCGSIPGYTVSMLLYYVEDGVLTIEGDKNEEILENFDEVQDMIGDALTRFGFATNDEPVIYIRNAARKTDYEISKVFGAFADY